MIMDFSEKKKESKNEIIETKNMINIYTNKYIETDKKQKEKDDIQEKEKMKINKKIEIKRKI